MTQPSVPRSNDQDTRYSADEGKAAIGSGADQ
jgi:hypothetical protein